MTLCHNVCMHCYGRHDVPVSPRDVAESGMSKPLRFFITA